MLLDGLKLGQQLGLHLRLLLNLLLQREELLHDNGGI